MASKSGNNKIVLKGDYGQWEEGTLKVAAYPGTNVVLAGDEPVYNRDSYTPGGTDYIGTGTGGSAVTTVANPVMVLVENALKGDTVDTQWPANEACQIFIPKKGDVIQVLVRSGQTVRKGEGGTANSDGLWSVDASNPSVVWLEDSDGALAANTLIRARVP